MPGDTAIATAQVSQAAARLDALEAVYALVAEDFAAVNCLIPRQLTSDVGLVEEIGEYIVASGMRQLTAAAKHREHIVVLLHHHRLYYNAGQLPHVGADS